MPGAEAHFSPGEACRRRIVELMAQARSSIDICVFTITDNRVSEPILGAHHRGVAVRIITDNFKSEDRGSDVDRLRGAGIAVREDRSHHHMHHKYALFDRKTLMTGSYNWTRTAADHNRENIIVVETPTLVRAFRDNFEELWETFS